MRTSSWLFFPLALATLVGAFGQTGVITTVAGSGVAGFSGDGGPAQAAALDSPTGVAVDSLGNLYIADPEVHRVRKVSPEGIISTVAGTGRPGFSGDGGPAVSAELNSPISVAVDAEGNLYIADRLNSVARKVTPAGVIETVSALGAMLQPMGIAVDGEGNVYLAGGLSWGEVRKLTPASVMSIVVTGQLNLPRNMAVDGEGNLYIADTDNNRVRKVTPTGGITTVAEGLGRPVGVAVSLQGDLYISDTLNHRIVKAEPSGLITVAGSGSQGFSGDGGPATSAPLSFPYAIAVDSSGELYIADTLNHRVRKVRLGDGPQPQISQAGIVNGASYSAHVAPAAISSIFGTNLAGRTAGAETIPLPTVLAGTQVEIKDSADVSRSAALFYASPSQINCQIPEETAIGIAQVTVRRDSGSSSSAEILIEPVAPGLFAAAGTGGGVAAAQYLRMAEDGTSSSGFVFDPDTFAAVAVDFGAATDQIFLVLFGTGIRFHGGLSAATATVGGQQVPVTYAGEQGGFVGLDQVNIGPLPRSLAGRGEAAILLTVDGKTANPVTVSVR